MLAIDPHPLLDLVALEVHLPHTLGSLASPPELVARLASNADAPIESSDAVRLQVRNLLRHGGFKPAGRSKPASEYLLKAAANERLGPINLAVDVCNVVSLHSGLPISVVDLDRVNGDLGVGIAAANASYVFNASGQEIDISGLLVLHDSLGPCANAVKDAQRTKTDDDSTRCLYVVWGSLELPDRARNAAEWLATLLEENVPEVTIRTVYPPERPGGD